MFFFFQESSSFTDPSDIASLQAWFDASDSDTVTTSGTTLTGWADKSGNGNDVTSIAGSPQLQAAELNGKDTISFTSAAAVVSGTFSMQGTTTFIVYNYDAFPSSGTAFRPILGNAGNSNHFIGALDTASGPGYSYYVHGSGDAVRQSNTQRYPVAGDYFTLCAGTDVANATAYYEENYWTIGRDDNILDFTGTGDLLIGRNGFGVVGNASIAEIIIYDAELTEIQKIQVKDYLANKWQHHPATTSYKLLSNYAQRHYVTSGGTTLSTRNLTLIGGQSNAVGTNVDTPIQADSPVVDNLATSLSGDITGVKVYNSTSDAFEQLNIGTNNGGSSASAEAAFGIEASLSYGLYNQRLETQYLLKYAIGGAAISNWEPVENAFSNYFWDTISLLEEATWHAGEDDSVNLILDAPHWIQGESDSVSEALALAYQAKEAAVYTALDKLFPFNKFISHKLITDDSPPSSGTYPWWETTNAGKDTNAASLPKYYVTREHADASVTHDGVHWNADEYVDYGYEGADIQTGATVPRAFVPTDLANLELWLDGADVDGDGTSPADAASVDTWVDKSGSSNDLSSTLTLRPVYDATNSAVVFDGANDRMDLDSGDATVFNFLHQGAHTCFYVVNYDGDSGANNCIVATGGYTVAGTYHGINDQASSGDPFLINTHNGTGVSQNFNNAQTGILQDSEKIILSVYGDYTTSGGAITADYNGLFYNFKNTTRDGNAVTANTALKLGASAVNTQEFKGSIHEVIIYNRVLTDAEKLDVVSYLNTKWS